MQSFRKFVEKKEKKSFWDNNSTTYFATYHNIFYNYRGNLNYLASTNDNNCLSPENTGFCRMKEAPAKYCKGALIGAEGLEQDATDPQKQGLFDNGDNAAPQFCPQVNFYEQIIDLFDRLTPDEQTALLDALQARIQSAAGISR